LLGYGESSEFSDLATALLASASNISDTQLIVGSYLGLFGILLEGIGMSAIYFLLKEKNKKYAKLYIVGILVYVWLAPIGCHFNVGVLNIAYKYLYTLDIDIAKKAADIFIYYLYIPVWVILAVFWTMMIVIQYKAFKNKLTVYPTYAKHFNLLLGIIPCLIIVAIVGPDTALGAGIATMFLNFGNCFVFAGLLLTIPSQEEFTKFYK